jgi:O-antigen/teichoic acid export membrane protein
MVYWVLAARYYPAEAVGLNAAAISTMMFLSGIAQLNLMSALIRFIPNAGRATGRLVGYAYLLSSVVAASAGLIFALSIGAWPALQGFLGASPWLIFGFILTSIISCIFTLQDSVLTGLRQTVWIPIENMLFAVAKIALLIIFANSSQRYGIFASWSIPVAISLLPVNLLIFRWLIPQHVQSTKSVASPIVLPQIGRYVIGNFFGSVFALISSTLLPAIVTYQAGATANAYFYQPWLIAGAVQFISVNMATSLTVEAAADQTKLAAYVRRSFLHTARMLVPIVLIVLYAAPFILSIFGSSYATEGSDLLRLLTLSSIPNIIVTMYIGFARVQHHNIGIVVTQGVLCVLVLGLSYLLMPIYGITGVGLACLVSQSIVALILVFTQLRSVLHAIHSNVPSPDRL